MHPLLDRLHRRLHRWLRHKALSTWDALVRRARGGSPDRFVRITDRLWLGGQPGRRGLPRLAAAGVTAVVNLRDEYDYAHRAEAGGLRYLHLPTVDHEAPALAHLAEGVAFVRDELARGGHVYVHCLQGVGRGPTLAAAYFVAEEGLSPEAAWARVRQGRPIARPNAKQRARLDAFARGRRAERESPGARAAPGL
ncbi:MAG: dual specificity protein phosphatase [Rhodothermales bacterium]|nr:dual specificity protein phosphatase [Rhodothermales bacterium]